MCFNLWAADILVRLAVFSCGLHSWRTPCCSESQFLRYGSGSNEKDAISHTRQFWIWRYPWCSQQIQCYACVLLIIHLHGVGHMCKESLKCKGLHAMSHKDIWLHHLSFVGEVGTCRPTVTGQSTSTQTDIERWSELLFLIKLCMLRSAGSLFCLYNWRRIIHLRSQVAFWPWQGFFLVC